MVYDSRPLRATQSARQTPHRMVRRFLQAAGALGELALQMPLRLANLGLRPHLPMLIAHGQSEMPQAKRRGISGLVSAKNAQQNILWFFFVYCVIKSVSKSLFRVQVVI